MKSVRKSRGLLPRSSYAGRGGLLCGILLLLLSGCSKKEEPIKDPSYYNGPREARNTPAKKGER